MRILQWCKPLVLGIMLMAGQVLFAQELKDDKGYKEQLASIESKLKSGDLANALQSIEETLEKYPNGAEVYYAKSLLYAQARNFDVALPAAEEAVKISPENILYNNHLLELYKSKGDFASAVELLDEFIKKQPNNPQVYREKIMMQHAGKKSEDALKTYEETKAKFGETDTLDVLKAEILMDMDRPREANEVLQQWRKKKSPIRQVYSSLSYILMDEKKPKDALNVLEEGLSTTKDDLLYLDMADANMAMKKGSQAFENIKKAFQSDAVTFIDKHRVMMNLVNNNKDFTKDQLQDLANTLVLKHPRMPDSHMFKGDILWMRGDLDQAKSLYLTTVSMNPQHVDAWRKLINVELAQNKLDEAIVDGKEALSHNPGNVIITYFVGVAYMMKKDTNNARLFLERALDQSGNENDFVKSMIYGGLGDLYHEIKMESASEVAYDEAIKLDSNNVTVMNNAAYYLSLQKKDLEKAAEYAKKANEMEPNSGTFQDTYAWVLFQQGKYQEALVWIEKAIKNSEPSGVLFDHYGDILIKLGKTKEALKQWEKAMTFSEGSALDKEKLKQKISEKKYIE
ncbi:Tetratricopeptide repeat-containing protein [Sphingobacterium mizutaii]|uniref:tetratricopeptide repeat protein n=1 Tax=Sphingobacterium mizutaii TaxID=1010 RepID=UPI000883CAF4|nr:tetratricopeptide repeat protein [Sphingobacterium mizutaii]SDL39170.1 Tetratricopeptide repeat-containing protein [Sphingobacterium mizutaii]